MVVSGCTFEFCLDVGAGICRFQRSVTLGDAVFLSGMLFLISTLICDVSLWGAPCGVVFCLEISSNLLMACNFLTPMDTDGAVGAGSEIASIKASAAFVAAS